MARRPKHPVLIVNPASGGGKATDLDLVGECRTRGIEAIVFERGDDLASLAERAIQSGADVIGMAGGDGSQACVAEIAARHDVPHVCVPAGTRNHFAVDIGLDRSDLIGALDAFVDGEERRIDMARVNGRVFVNNVSMGMYGELVSSDDYRDAKIRTLIGMLPNLLGSVAKPYDLRFTSPDGTEFDGVQLLLVSNNSYSLDPLGPRGNRNDLNDGTLGVLAVQLIPPRTFEWTTPTFRVESGAAVDAGVDGEAASLDPPLIFETMPGALRIRVPAQAARPPAPPRLPKPAPG